MSSSQESSSNIWRNYTLQKIINAGKFTVLLTRCDLDSKEYIIKVFPNDKISRRSYRQENYIHSSLSHPNIIQYVPTPISAPPSILTQENQESNYILMEYAPYGDFFNLVTSFAITQEKLVRTFFHHLIEGLGYIHSRNIAHLDLKLENLLLGNGHLLKIADFDLSLAINQKSKLLLGQGTENYRSPELLSGDCEDYYAADIYSAGICLYVLMTGAFPFIEGRDEDTVQFFRYDTFQNQNEEFWEENEALLDGNVRFSKSFRDLINKMWTRVPSKRITIEGIIKSEWYNGPVYDKDELQTELRKILTP